MHRKKTDKINANRFPLRMQEEKHKPPNKLPFFLYRTKKLLPRHFNYIFLLLKYVLSCIMWIIRHNSMNKNNFLIQPYHWFTCKTWTNIPYLVVNYIRQSKTQSLSWKKQKAGKPFCFAFSLFSGETDLFKKVGFSKHDQQGSNRF